MSETHIDYVLNGSARMHLDQASLDSIRQIVQEELQQVFPHLTKPDTGIPACPECGKWDLSEHSLDSSLNHAYRAWWCSCPEKVQAWEKRSQEYLDQLLESIHAKPDPDEEITAILTELSATEFEALVQRVREMKREYRLLRAMGQWHP